MRPKNDELTTGQSMDLGLDDIQLVEQFQLDDKSAFNEKIRHRFG